MAGYSIIRNAKDNALRAIQAGASTQRGLCMARESVYDVHKATKERLDAYKSNRAAQLSIRNAYNFSWEVVDALDKLIAQPFDPEKTEKMLTLTHIIVSKLDSMSEATDMNIRSMIVQLQLMAGIQLDYSPDVLGPVE